MSGPAALPRRDGLRRALEPLPTVLALVAEGAWIAVVYAFVEAASGHGMALNAAWFAVLAAAGLVGGTAGPRRMPRTWPVAAVALTALAGVAGALVGDETRAALASGDPIAAVAFHPGGWLAGLAFFRGIAAARPGHADDDPSTLMPGALTVILGMLLVGSALREPARAAFLGAALPSTVVFIAAGTVAPALARMRSLGQYTGFDWRRNPAWLGLLGVLVIGILAVAVPAAYSLGPLVVLVVAALPVPLFIVGMFSGVDWRLLRRAVLPLLLVFGVVVVLRLFFGPGSRQPQQTGPGFSPGPSDVTSPVVAVTVSVLFFAALAVTIAVLAAIWMRQVRTRSDDDVAEERVIDRGEVEAPEHPHTRRRWRRRPEPQDAPSAYLAALEDLDRSEAYRRLAPETPGEHARRVRTQLAPSQPPFGAALELLAADYELARFGDAALTDAEHRRAHGRWLRIRQASRR